MDREISHNLTCQKIRALLDFAPLTGNTRRPMAHLLVQLLAQSRTPSVPLGPLVILALCVVGGVGTVLLLPSRREAPLRKIGGIILLAVALIFVALLVRWKTGDAAAAAAAG